MPILTYSQTKHLADTNAVQHKPKHACTQIALLTPVSTSIPVMGLSDKAVLLPHLTRVQEAQLAKRFDHQADTLVKNTKCTCVILPFPYHRANESCKQLKLTITQIVVNLHVWNDNNPYLMQSVDGIDLFYLFSNFLSARGLDDEEATVSHDMINNCGTFSRSMEYINHTHMVSYHVNSLLAHINPTYYAAAQEVHAKSEDELPFSKRLGYSDPLVYEGCELLMNRKTPNHTNNSDLINSWMILIAGADTVDTDMYTCNLNLCTCFCPSDAIAIHGKCIVHSVPHFTDGQHISVAYFTHKTTMGCCWY
ncbi:hypothetical protein C8R46DRAFT_1330011 [Mycena filopes]|nr:hypothetical protein C8R46DRAFT_1330011 [Mycena filopes]